MRFAHVIPPGSADPRLVVVEGDEVVVVEDLFDGAPRVLEELIAGGDELLARVRDAAAAGGHAASARRTVVRVRAAHPAASSSRSA